MLLIMTAWRLLYQYLAVSNICCTFASCNDKLRQKMKIRSVLCFLLGSVMLAVPASAQKREIDEARDLIKVGGAKELDKAEKLMTTLLSAKEENRQNVKIYLTWYDAVLGKYALANEKLYVKAAYDTAAFFNLTKQLFDIALRLDTLDAAPDNKGRVRPKYRKGHAAELDRLRANLYTGGIYFVRKNDYAQAFDYLSQYLDAATLPLFTGYDYLVSDGKMPQAAYWATFCAHRQKQPDQTLRYSTLACRDSAKQQFTLQYICEAYHLLHDERSYVNTLNEAFRLYPEYPYFFPRLADYYNSKGQNDSVLVIADYGLSVNKKYPLFLLAKSIALLNLERFDECRDVSKQLIAVNDTMPEPYFNIATSYLNQALDVEELNEPRKNREKLRQLYSEARPYMEKYRQLAPDDQQRWAPALYRIYLNLNLGRQFEEIDRLMRQ